MADVVVESEFSQIPFLLEKKMEDLITAIAILVLFSTGLPMLLKHIADMFGKANELGIKSPCP